MLPLLRKLERWSGACAPSSTLEQGALKLYGTFAQDAYGTCALTQEHGA